MWFLSFLLIHLNVPLLFQLIVSSASFSRMSMLSSCFWIRGNSTSSAVTITLLYQPVISSRLSTYCKSCSLLEKISAAMSGIDTVWLDSRYFTSRSTDTNWWMKNKIYNTPISKLFAPWTSFTDDLPSRYCQDSSKKQLPSDDRRRIPKVCWKWKL